MSFNFSKSNTPFLAPYISNLNHYVYYDHYDLKEYLREGRNVIGIILGNGMLNCMGGYTWGFDKANYRSAPMVAFALSVDNVTIEADETVKVCNSPITFDEISSSRVLYTFLLILETSKSISAIETGLFSQDFWIPALTFSVEYLSRSPLLFTTMIGVISIVS